MQKTALALIRIYQRIVAPYVKCQCKFYPSCSHYAALSIGKFGLWSGMIKAIVRILKCNPFAKGGVDFP